MKISSWGKRAKIEAATSTLITLCAAACAAPVASARPTTALAGSSSRPDPVAFAFDSLDDRLLTSDSTRGRPTVLAFVTTASLAAQAQVDFLVAMAKRDGDQIRYGVVALEPPENRELVELYVRALSIGFPVAMADLQTLAGVSAFGDVRSVPVTVVLDSVGRIVWRVDGRIARSDEIRAAMLGL
ncbi:MAG: hypothetical protein ABSF69_04845 [Polyangiaceae bacterium]